MVFMGRNVVVYLTTVDGKSRLNSQGNLRFANFEPRLRRDANIRLATTGDSCVSPTSDSSQKSQQPGWGWECEKDWTLHATTTGVSEARRGFGEQPNADARGVVAWMAANVRKDLRGAWRGAKGSPSHRNHAGTEYLGGTRLTPASHRAGPKCYFNSFPAGR